MSKMMWYVLQVKNGKEEEIRDKLIGYGFHALVPSHNKWTRSKGSWSLKKTIIFTGYVFVKLNYDAESYYKITNTDGVVRFLGEKTDPSYLTFIEAEWIRLLGENGVLEPTEVMIENGQLKVLKGILLNFKSRIKSFDARQRKAIFEIHVLNEVKEITLSIDVINADENDTSEE